MRIGFVGTTSNDDGCPTVWATDRGTLVIQGTTVTDPEALAAMQSRGNGLPDHESAVEVPAELLPFLALQALEKLPLADHTRPRFTIDGEAAAHLRATLEGIMDKAAAGSQ